MTAGLMRRDTSPNSKYEVLDVCVAALGRAGGRGARACASTNWGNPRARGGEPWYCQPRSALLASSRPRSAPKSTTTRQYTRCC